MSFSRFQLLGFPMMHRLRYMQRRLMPELSAIFPHVFEEAACPRKLVYVEWAEVNRTHRPTTEQAPEEDSPVKKETAKQNSNVFKVAFNVGSFNPNEIKIKAADTELIIEGEREVDDLTSHFVRHYVLPRELDTSSIKSSLSKEGVLTIEAKKIIENERKGDWKTIDVEAESCAEKKTG